MISEIRNLLILLRLELRLLGRKGSSGNGGRPKSRGGILLTRLSLLTLIVVGVSFSLGDLLSVLVSGSSGRLILPSLLAWASSWAMLLVFVFAVPLVLGQFTVKSDLKLLLLTPVSPRSILAEKFLALYASLTLPLLLIGLFMLSGIGGALNLGVPYYLMAIVVLLLLPLVPLSLAMLLMVLVLRWIPPAKARGVTAVLGTAFGMVIYLGFQLVAGGPGSARLTQLQSSFARSPDSQWSRVPAAWPGQALAAAGLGDTWQALSHLTAALLCGVILAGLAILASAHLFATGWATYQEQGRRRRRLVPNEASSPGAEKEAGSIIGTPQAASSLRIGQTAAGRAGLHAAGTGLTAGTADLKIGLERGSPSWWPLLGKEWRSLRRDPQVWAQLLYPLFLAAFWSYRSAAQFGSTSRSASATISSNWFYGVLTFMACLLLPTLALPVINREGRSLSLLALMPLSARQILLAKWTFCAAPVLVLIEVLNGVVALFLDLPVEKALLAALVFAGLIIALTGFLLLVTLTWPKLDSDNPRRRVSTAASLLGSFGCMALGAVSCGLLILSFVVWPNQPLVAAGLLAAIFGICGAVGAAVTIQAPRRLATLLVGPQ